MSLTKAEVYTSLGISQPMVSMIRSGQRNPSVKMLRRLSAAELAAGLVPPQPPALVDAAIEDADRRMVELKSGSSGDIGRAITLLQHFDQLHKIVKSDPSSFEWNVQRLHEIIDAYAAALKKAAGRAKDEKKS